MSQHFYLFYLRFGKKYGIKHAVYMLRCKEQQRVIKVKVDLITHL